MKYRILTSLLFMIFTCCGEEPSNWTIEKQRINELLNLSTENINIDGTTLELHAYLWRDFMPSVGFNTNNSNLISINWLLDKDSVRIPDNIILSQQFVIHGDSLWTADYTTELHETQPYLIEKVSRNGPKWETEIKVTVVAKIVDLNNNSEYYLRRENITIIRTS